MSSAWRGLDTEYFRYLYILLYRCITSLMAFRSIRRVVRILKNVLKLHLFQGMNSWGVAVLFSIFHTVTSQCLDGVHNVIRVESMGNGEFFQIFHCSFTYLVFYMLVLRFARTCRSIISIDPCSVPEWPKVPFYRSKAERFQNHLKWISIISYRFFRSWPFELGIS